MRRFRLDSLAVANLTKGASFKIKAKIGLWLGRAGNGIRTRDLFLGKEMFYR